MNDAKGTVTPWIQHNAAKVDPAWAFAEAQRMRKKKLPDPPPRVQDRKERFKAAMRAYFRHTEDSQAKDIFEHTTTWEEVRSEAQKALDLRYKQNGKKNFFRKSIRVVGDVASRLEFLTELIPSGDYMGVICGGLKLVYNAANRMSTVREFVLGSLDSLSQPIQDVSPYLYTYSWSEELLEKSHELYMCVLDAVEEITLWISKTKGVVRGVIAIGKAFVQQDDYGKKLETKITTSVGEKAIAFEKAVKSCLSIEVHDMGQNVVRIGEGQDEMKDNLRRAAASLERLEAILQDKIKQMQPILDAYDSAQAPPVTRVHITIEQLLTALHLTSPFPDVDVVDHTVDVIITERRRLLVLGGLLDGDAEDQIAGVLQDCRFRTWLQVMRSEVLVVSMMEEDILQESPVSPLTYICSMLLKSFASTERVVPVAFFCREHCDPQDNLAGASGMMRSLIAQVAVTLTEANSLDLSFLVEDSLHTIASQDLSTMCDLFANVIKRIPTGIVLCMIDGVDYFSNQIHIHWLDWVMRFLNSLVEYVSRSRSDLVFKILLTSHRGASLASQWFPYRVDLPMVSNETMYGLGLATGEMQSIF
ncbi:uncharacterized protein BO97DRAFT_409832 [Aspergillus homomorphus CBS 101889]|uniref:Nephrocystin 3-like N-terminal domain-containing protein n=1 Tax=Aspergillus homomorphus (strain CBS 101889) TaxID=1450537 RepID=A0A395IGS2_ASPHC|nr:hypothetical protein BO97DRAFT_409832 [Aspergillus homomorphus CBS 101889]RAL17394.1 hypothetical protein BO97DRAFT_409832 [Aspergillus homomorphus CBS 101889]